jgi:hypothetical protein
MKITKVACVSNVTGYIIGIVLPGITTGKCYDATINGRYYEVRNDNNEIALYNGDFFQVLEIDFCQSLANAKMDLESVIASWEVTRESMLKLVDIAETAWTAAAAEEASSYDRLLSALCLLDQGDRQRRTAEDRLKQINVKIKERKDG